MDGLEVTGRKVGIEPRALSVKDTCAALGVSRAHLYVLVKRGELRLVKLGFKSVVPVSEIRRLLGEATEAA